LNCGGKLPRHTQLPTDNRRDLDGRPPEFFGCESEHARPVGHNGLLGLKRLVGSSFAGNEPGEGKGDEENDPTSFVKRET
jgi:hypothetical protein